MSNYYAEQIVKSVSMPQLLEYYGFNVNRAGFICCPFHGEKTPSLKSYPGTGGFHCFGCGEHGNVIDFVMKYFHLSFPDAMKQINHDFMLSLPIGEKISKRRRIDSARQMYERRTELNRKNEEEQRIRDNYWKAFDEWKRLNENRIKYKPRSPFQFSAEEMEKLRETELHPLFIESLQKLAYQEYLLDCAENEVRKFERD